MAGRRTAGCWYGNAVCGSGAFVHSDESHFVRRHLMSRFSMRQLRAPVILENRNCKSRIATFSYTLRAN